MCCKCDQYMCSIQTNGLSFTGCKCNRVLQTASLTSQQKYDSLYKANKGIEIYVDLPATEMPDYSINNCKSF